MLSTYHLNNTSRCGNRIQKASSFMKPESGTTLDAWTAGPVITSRVTDMLVPIRRRLRKQP